MIVLTNENQTNGAFNSTLSLSIYYNRFAILHILTHLSLFVTIINFIYIYIYTRAHNKFPDFFRMGI